MNDQHVHIKLRDGYGSTWHYVSTPGVNLVITPLQAMNVTSITVEWVDVPTIHDEPPPELTE